MRGINRLKLTLTMWTAAALSLGGAGCQEMYPGAPPGMYSPSSYTTQRSAYAPSEITQVGHQSSSVPTMPATLPEASGPTHVPPVVGNVPPVVEDAPSPPAPLPHEKTLTMHPTYIIEPPDTLLIDAIRLIPRPPYRIEPLDVLIIQVAEALPGQPIAGAYAVTPEGTVNLGYSYQETAGPVRVAGLTLEQAVLAIKAALRRKLNDPQVAIALASLRAIQQIRGEHLVGQDGTVTLGSYGCVNVTGLTVWQAKMVIERYLSQWFLTPNISLTVNGYNSKVYYIIFDGGGYGQQIVPLPITGSETVLRAFSLVGGLPSVSSRCKMWVSRPSPKGCYQLLPINWDAITKGGDPETNWQLFPGDRIYVEADPLICLDNTLAKILNPIERVLGVILLGAETYQTIHTPNGGIGLIP